jgi:hypothetical protein
MRVAPCCSSSELTATDLPECVRFSVPAFLSLPAAERFALFVDAPQASSGMEGVVNGVLFLQIKVVPGSCHHTATIHAIGVREATQNRGMASSLLMHAIDVALSHCMREMISPELCPSYPAAGSCVEFCLARGPCLHTWDVLLLLSNHGWVVRKHGQSQSQNCDMSASDIRKHRAEGAPPVATALRVRGPLVSLDAPLLYPGVASGRGLFKTTLELPAAPSRKRGRDRWDCSYSVNSAIRRGTFPLSQLSATYPMPGTGLLPFTAPLLECQKFQCYLEDWRRHSYEVHVDAEGQHVYKHGFHLTSDHGSTSGKPLLLGYQEYSTLNGKHNPALQSARTLKTFSRKSIDDLIHQVPGCAGILMSAMARLGHGDLSLEEVTRMVQHVHMLLLDSTSQVDFGWHEDTYDLSIQDGVRDTMLSIIVQLSATFTTAMQLHGFAYHEYGGQGSGIIFHGRAVHRSVPRIRVPPHHAVWKVAFFVDARRLHVDKRQAAGTSACAPLVSL